MVWDAKTGDAIFELQGTGHLKGYGYEEERLNEVKYSPSGKSIVSVSNNRTIKFWDAVTGKETRKIQGHTDQVNSIAFFPDGKHFVTASADKTLKIWELETGD